MPSNLSPHTFTTSSRFSYTPLTRPTGFIRTIKVLPDLRDGLIQCQLEQIAIEESTAYTCLSYVWGNPGDDYQIIVNGQTFAVRKNLHEFLSAARQRFPHPLWVDAISINQSDLQEKNQQVMQMGDVYRNAYWVIAWLGTCPELDPIVNLDRSIIDEWANRNQNSEDSTDDESASETSQQPLLTLGKEREVVEALQAVGNLSEHAYLTRAWIVQEMALADSLHIWTSSGETVNVAISLIGSIAWKEKQHLAKLYGSDEVDNFFNQMDRHSPGMMMNILLDGANTASSSDNYLDLFFESGIKCEDLRDRVYSLRPLLDEGSTFDVDYQEDLMSLFYRTCNHFELWYTDRDLALMNLLNITTENLESDQNEKNYAFIPIKMVSRIIDSSWQKPNGAVDKCQNCPLALIHPAHELLLRQSTEDDLTPKHVTFEGGEFDLLGCLAKNNSDQPRTGHVQFCRNGEGKYTVSNGFWFTKAERYENSGSRLRFGHMAGMTLLEKDGSKWTPALYPRSNQEYIDHDAQAREFRLAISKADIIERSKCPGHLRHLSTSSNNHD